MKLGHSYKAKELHEKIGARKSVLVGISFGSCTALVVGCDDVAPCYSVGVLIRRQVDSWEGSREARIVADS